MTTEELETVKDLVLREVPHILEQDPGFAVFIEGLLSEKFPRRDEFARLLDELQATRAESRQQLVKVDERFVKVDEQFEAARAENRQQFVRVDERFAKVDERLVGVERRLDELETNLTRQIQGLQTWMELNIGGFQNKAGRRLEDVVAGAFCYALKRNDILPEQVLLRQVITDEAGLVYRPGRRREVDIIAHGKGIIVFEVKSTADRDDVDDLADKVALVRHQHPGQLVEGVLVMWGAETSHRQWCAEKGLRLIP